MAHDDPYSHLSPEEAARKKRVDTYRWPVILISLLASQVVLMVALLYLANSNPSFAVEQDYYQKAMAWDEHAAQVATNQRLGWRAVIDVSDKADFRGNRELTCTLADAQGFGIADAKVELVGFPHARASERINGELHFAGDGQYRGAVRMRRGGKWEFRLRVERGTDVFTKRIVQFVTRLERRRQ